MANLPLGMVDPKDWLSRTSLAFSRTRSGTLAKVDAAYAKYYTLRSPDNGLALHIALENYLIEKGRNWEKVDRNKRSGGLMAFLYNATAPSKASANILERRVPDARHGMLYLWQNADVSTQWAQIILEGALTVGSNTMTMLQASNYQTGDKLASLGVFAKNSTGDKIAKGVQIGNTARGMLLAPKGTAEPIEAIKPTVKLADLKDDPSVIERAKQWLGSKFQLIYDTISQMVKGIWLDIRLKYYRGEFCSAAGSAIVSLVNFILGKVAAHAAPLVGSSINLGQGICKTIVAAKERLTAYQQRSKFIISPGHPNMIANSIERQMNWAIGKGIYQAVKGGAMLAGDLLSMGATALINVIAACMEFAWKFLTRMVEGFSMRAWIGEVKAVTSNRNDYKADPLDGKLRPRICFNDKAFLLLAEYGFSTSPCVPMMTLNSGISGDLMMFTKMFDDTGGILGQGRGISSNGSRPSASAQKTFDSAEAYWTQMKQYGRTYMASTGFKFSSSDKVAQGLMAHALTHHQTGKMATSDKVLSFLAGS